MIFDVQDFLVQFRELILENLVVVFESVFADVIQGKLINVFQFQLQLEQLQQVVLVIGLIHALHQRGFARAFSGIGFTVRMQRTDQLAIHLADRLAQLPLLGLLPGFLRELFGRLGAFGPTVFVRLSLGVEFGLAFMDFFLGAGLEFIGRADVQLFAEIQTQRVFQHILHAFEIRCFLKVVVRLAVAVVNAFHLGILARRDQLSG